MQDDDPNNDPGHATASGPQHVSSVRIVYCNSCGCQLNGLRIGEPCPNCQVPVGSAAQTGGKTNGKAIAALVLGICSFVGCMLYGLPGIICAVLAIIFAGQVRRGVESGEMDASSMGMANAGRICGIVGLCLSILYMLVAIAWMVFVFAFMMPQQQQMMQHNINQQMQQIQQQQPPSGQYVPPQPEAVPQPEIDETESPTTNP